MALEASDVMRREIVAARPHDQVRDLVRTLAERRISGAPVVDERGRPIGVISLYDVAELCLSVAEAPGRPSAFYTPDDDGAPWLERVPLERIHGLRVSDVMTPWVVDVPRDAPIDRVARQMIDWHVHRVLVTEDAGRSLVGIIAASDILALVAGRTLVPAVASAGDPRCP